MRPTIRCSCGGSLRPAVLERFDLRPWFGFHIAVEGSLAGLRCDRCGGETLAGAVVEGLRLALARTILSRPRLLAGEEARFLRKSILGRTQEGLAEWMHIHKVTIADWERGARSISREHDYELRGLVVSALLRSASPVARSRPWRREWVRLAGEVLGKPREVKAPRRSRRDVIRADDLAA